MSREAYVYILCNRPNGVPYAGVTSELIRRVYQHWEKVNQGFTAKYNVSRLVYFESVGDIYSAISREKQIKSGSRQKRSTLSNEQILSGETCTTTWFRNLSHQVAAALTGFAMTVSLVDSAG